MGRPRIRTHLGAWAFVVATIGWMSPSQAFVRTTTSVGAPFYWNRDILHLLVYAGEPPPQLSSDDVVNAVRAAAETWSRGKNDCTALEIRVDSTTESNARVEVDYTSRFTFRRDDWCRDPPQPDGTCYDPFALAVTSVFARKKDGEIVDADMEVNAVNFEWSDLVRKPEGAQSLYDLQNAVTHEMGHFIGLDHTCVIDGTKSSFVDNLGHPVPTCTSAPPDILATTMVAIVVQGDTERRSLSPDDVTALCSLYPALDVQFQSLNGGGCSVSAAHGTGSAARRVGGVGIAALLLMVFSVFRRRSARPSTASPSGTDRAQNR